MYMAQYYRGAVGCFLVYDVTHRASFDGMKNWLRQVRENSHENIIIGIIGNKLDLVEEASSARQISTEEGREYALSERAFFYEASAKSAANVVEAFMKVIHTVCRLLPKDMAQPVEGGAALPEGWRKVPSRSRPGEFSYENIATGVRVAYVPSLPPVSESSSRGATNPNANQRQLSVAERQELRKRRQQRCCLIS